MGVWITPTKTFQALKGPDMKTPFRLIAALLAWASIIMQYVLMVTSGEFGGLANSSLMFFGYFTILTNILVATAFTAHVMPDGNRLKSFFHGPHVRAALALYILVVAVVYHMVLAELHNPVGLNALTNIGLHTVIPVLYIFDWVIFANKRLLSYKTIPLWIIYPLVYGFLTLGRGLLTGFYPYPFLDVTQVGFSGFATSMLGFTVLYGIGAAIFITLGRALSKS